MKTVLALLSLIILSFGLVWGMPLPKTELSKQSFSFYDRAGELLYKESAFQDKSEALPEFLQAAIIELEDQNFRTHAGVDFKALLRATTQNLAAGSTVSGASTITMQLARLRYLEPESRNWWYKMRQTFWAFKLEQQLSKTEILNDYLNRVSLGYNVKGFPGAADHYFSKRLDQLSIGEMATLLAIVQNPSQFNPISNPELSVERRNLMLRRLREGTLISETDFNFWTAEPLVIKPHIENFIIAPHFVFWVKNQLSELNLPNTEIKVYTTLDKTLYQDTLHILQEVIKREQQSKKLFNGSVVVLDRQNNIRVMVGSPDFFDDTIDGAVNLATSVRQTGSVLKPFLYTLALEKGLSPASALNDQKTIFPEGYLPRNFNIEEENGSVRFREALANSYNIAAVDLLNRIGVGNFYALLRSVGINLQESVDDLGLSLVLGSAQASLLSVTQAFSVFTHQGELRDLNFIVSLKTTDGEVIYEPAPTGVKKVFSTDSAEWAQQVLSDNEARWKNFSRGNSLELDFPSGGKTGTSQAFRDNWVVGFSPQFTVGVWVGNANGAPMIASSGMQGAGPIWQRVMQRLHRDQPRTDFIFKGNRTLSRVCRRPGETNCSERVPVFLTPKELKALNTVEAFLPETFQIVYPAEGDVFAEGSSLLIQTRGAQSQVTEYRHNGAIQTSPIFENLSVGMHAFEVRTLDGDSDLVHILVEAL
ncbi:hypothetical protein GW756_04355 [bacterium]|nr:hypothetical protein [bacterium]NCQ55168.1 hypothetical protein [Candidatus Parcubacteria bacterium]NCS67319.1 hypothetical protein [Candidatus Peregrinibacteria bacterium]NCS96574.1 hypothetical protein [bacterium]